MSTNSVSSAKAAPLTAPGLTQKDGHAVGTMLQERLYALNDLALVLKHVHWNVVGPHFIGVHTMLDPQVDGVRAMVDDIAERMALLGIAPNGLAGAMVEQRSWDDYALMRADATAHLGALDMVYTGVIEDHRSDIDKLGELDPVSEDMLISQVADLEKYQWFVRAHLQNAGGASSTEGADTEEEAAESALQAD